MADKSNIPTKNAEVPKKRPMCTGNVIHHMKAELKFLVDKENFDEATKKLSPEAKELFTGLILSDHWYPETVAAELFNVASKQIGKEMAKKVIRQAAKNQINAALKFFLRLFISPQKFAENNKKLWDSLHNSGDFKVTINEPKTHTIEISDFDFINDEYIAGWAEYHCGILELTGAKNVRYMNMQTRGKYIFKFEWD